MRKIDRLIKIANCEYRLGNYFSAIKLYNIAFTSLNPYFDNIFLHRALANCYMHFRKNNLALLHIEASISLLNNEIKENKGKKSLLVTDIPVTDILGNNLEILSELSSKLKSNLHSGKSDPYFRSDEIRDQEIKHSCIIQIVSNAIVNNIFTYDDKPKNSKLILDICDRLFDNGNYDEVIFLAQFVFNKETSLESVKFRIDGAYKILQSFLMKKDFIKAILLSNIALSYFKDERLRGISEEEKEKFLEFKKAFLKYSITSDLTELSLGHDSMRTIYNDFVSTSFHLEKNEELMLEDSHFAEANNILELENIVTLGESAL